MDFTSAKSRLMIPGIGDDVADALNGLAKNVVGDAKRFKETRAVLDAFHQAVRWG